ncbi:tol-pal system protein YbgF [Actibacterium sp. D379-3]
MRLSALLVSLILAFGAGGLPAAAQSRDETLADIRQQLSVLYVDVQHLKRELSTTGGVAGGTAGGSTLQRVDAIEQEMQRLTAKTEELEYRINQVVSDGTNRIGDLEFRLCELETACDIGTLGETTTLGGAGQASAPATPIAQPAPPAPPGGTELAVGEQADFDRAKAALDSGDFQGAATQFAAFTQTYPGGPLSGDAHFYRGEALSQTGQTADAARAFLESFSGAPNGPKAPDALYRLGMALQGLGQTREACVTLGEVGTRFPDAAITFDATAARNTFGCH